MTIFLLFFLLVQLLLLLCSNHSLNDNANGCNSNHIYINEKYIDTCHVYMHMCLYVRTDVHIYKQRGNAPTPSYLGNILCEYGTEIQYCPVHLPHLFSFFKTLLKKAYYLSYELMHSQADNYLHKEYIFSSCELPTENTKQNYDFRVVLNGLMGFLGRFLFVACC